LSFRLEWSHSYVELETAAGRPWSPALLCNAPGVATCRTLCFPRAPRDRAAAFAPCGHRPFAPFDRHGHHGPARRAARSSTSPHVSRLSRAAPCTRTAHVANDMPSSRGVRCSPRKARRDAELGVSRSGIPLMSRGAAC